MKKKLLSLVLAGAMVASTSVSAFADDSKTYEFTSGSVDHQVTITGDVQNTKGEVAPGTISVTVPTAMAFTIDKNGDINGGEIEIVNKGNETVEVFAKEFTDTTATSGVVVVKEDELSSKLDEGFTEGKRYITLNLTGGDVAVGLISGKAEGHTGFVNLTDNQEISSSVNTSLGKAWKENNLKLTLSGKAKKTGKAYQAPTEAFRDTFNLVLKIQKADKTSS